MATTAPSHSSARDVAYFRQRFKNRTFSSILEFVLREANQLGLTQKELAERAGKDPAQLSRLLTVPSNMTLETISDLLLAVGAEADPPRMFKFSEYEVKSNYAPPLYARVTGALNLLQQLHYGRLNNDPVETGVKLVDQDAYNKQLLEAA